jgi:hypothetical protein
MLKKFISRSLVIICLFFIIQAETKAQQISPLFFGLNAWMPDSTGSRFLNGPLHRRWKEVKDTRGNTVRVGGISFDRDMPTNHQYLKMVDSVRTAGMEPIIQVSFWKGRYTATQAANLVKFLNVTHKRNIKYWSIGNEPDHSGSYNYTKASEVAPYIKSFASAMKEADPSIKIIAPDCAWYNRAMLDPLTTPGGPHDITGKNSKGRFYVDYISYHQYPFRGQQTRSQVISNLNSPGGYRDRIIEMTRRLNNCNNHHGRSGSNRVKIGITEANIGYANPSGDNIYGLGTNSFIGGQFWVEMMGIAMQQGVEFINFWGMTNTLGMLDENNRKRPNYHHFQMMAGNFTGSAIKASTNLANVKVFASKSSTQTAVMILNQSSSTNHNYNLKLASGSVSGNNTLKINVDAAIDIEHSGNIQNQSTTLLIFDQQGNLTRRCEYKLVGHADKNLPPSCTNIAPKVAAAGPTVFCEGDSVTLSTNHSSGNTYQWKRNGNNISGATSNAFTATTSGDYFVEITNASGKRNSETTMVEAVNINAQITASGPIEFCIGGNVVLNASSGPGFTYQWKRNSQDIAGANGVSYTATTQGSYRVQISKGSCVKLSDGTPVKTGDPVATITVFGNTTACKEQAPLLQADNTNSTYLFQWRRNSQDIPGATNAEFTPQQSGSYRLAVTENGCTKISESTVITINSINANATAMGPLTLCTGDSVVLQADTAENRLYQWKMNDKEIAGANSSRLIAKETGNYSVAITANGCTEHASDLSVTILDKPLNPIVSTSGQNIVCNDTTVKLTAPTGEGYLYQWNRNDTAITGAHAHIFNANETGVYSVTIFNICATAASNNVLIEDCTTTGISSLEDDNGFTIFPNPTTGIATLEISADVFEDQPIRIDVLSSNGQLLKSYRPKAAHSLVREQIEMNQSYAEGIYLIRISSGSKTLSKKILLQR